MKGFISIVYWLLSLIRIVLISLLVKIQHAIFRSHFSSFFLSLENRGHNLYNTLLLYIVVSLFNMEIHQLIRSAKSLLVLVFLSGF